jgi:DNA-binding LytR/AlgR family response regulator
MEKELAISLDTFIPATDLVILCRGEVVLITYADIIRIVKKGSQVSVITNTHTHQCCHSLEEIAKDLPYNQFARVHKSHVISLDHLHLLGRHVPISRYHKRLLVRKLGAILDQHYRCMLIR